MQDRKTKKILIISVAGLIVLRLFSLLLIPYLPHLEQFKFSNLSHVARFKYSDHFSAIKEGDDRSYYDMAEMIKNFQFKESERTLGYPLMIAPLISLFGKNSFSNAFFLMIIFNSIFLFSAALILIVWASFLIFKKIAPAVLSGLIFFLFPYIFYIFRDYGPQFPIMAWNDINFFNMNWLAAMADQSAAFFTLLILFLLLIAERKKFRPFFYALIGFFAGFSVMIRITNIVVVAAGASIIFLYEFNKKYKKLILYCLFTLLGFLPQFIYNIIFFGSPFSFGYQKEYYASWITPGTIYGPMWDFQNFFHIIGRAADYSFFAIPAFLIIFAITLLGFLYIRKINKRNALIVIFWFFLPTLIYMFFETGQTAMRYYLPAVPAFVILFVAALCVICDWVKIKFFCRKINQGN